MKNIMNRIMVVFVFLALSACDKEGVPENGFGVVNPSTPQGIELTLTYPDGNEKKVKGDKVFGWNNGQLLNSDYYKHLRGGSAAISFDLRFSLPKTADPVAEIEGSHPLRVQRLRLEQTGDLGAVQAEFWLGTQREEDEFDAFKNVTGTINLQQKAIIKDKSYDVLAEIKGQVQNRSGQVVKVSGFIWKENAQN